MPLSPAIRKPLLVGASAGLLHFLLCVVVFAAVQFSTDGQAGFVWFAFFALDYPTGSLAYELLGNISPMTALIDWWYSIGNNQGPNIRALILFGILGSLHWFFVAALVAATLQRLLLIRHRGQERG
ncbi:MAG: hypothetical protein Q7T21_03190 [Gallionella sp.]|nr:hypothetical protein [Gallionella sp.]